MIHRLLRRTLGLPRRRCASDVEHLAVEMPDGVRLATTHVWPIDAHGPTPTLLLRTPYGVTTRPAPTLWLGRLLAESGYHVVLQDVRGRYASEGRFEPFVNEAGDGATTLDWLEGRNWSEGQVGMLGASYLSHCAWAATSLRPDRIGALAIAMGSSDLHPVFHPHGVFSFANAVEWAAGVGDHEDIDARHVDLDRAFSHEPVREADRVARCEVDFYRTWVDHPTHDAYWDEVRAPLPDPAPPTLFVGGWWDFFIEPQLADYAQLALQADRGSGPAPDLVLGPWSHGPIAHRKFWRDGMQRRSLGRIVRHFDKCLAGRNEGRPDQPVRYFVCDPEARGEWRESSAWPPPGAETLALHLHPDATGPGLGAATENDTGPGLGAATENDTGSGLGAAAASDTGRIEIEYDPADPTPSVGGAFFGWKAGSKDQAQVALRADVVCLESAPLVHDLVIAGPVNARLFVSAELTPADFAVHLVDAAPNGSMLEVGDGLGRFTPTGEAEESDDRSPDSAHALTVALGHRAWRFRAGHRLRVHLAPAHCPRFARARGPGVDDDTAAAPSKQWIFAGPPTPSRIELTLACDARFVV